MSVSSLKPRIQRSISAASRPSAVSEISAHSDLPSSASDIGKSFRPSYKDEMVTLFFNSMLGQIVQSKIYVAEPDIECEIASDMPDPNVIAKDFKELSNNDLLNSDVVKVDGSQVSLGHNNKPKKVPSKRSTSSRRSQGSNKSLVMVRKRKGSSQNKRNSITLPKISESTNARHLSAKEHSSEIPKKIIREPTEYVNLSFINGNYYEGRMRNNLFHGIGTFYWKDGTIYIGEFRNGQITGIGKMIYNDLSTYQGHFVNGRPHGMGAFYMSYSKTLYNGSWVYGKKQGKGWLFYSEKNWYEGEWFDGNRHGFGTRLYRDGSQYTGEWLNGERHGEAVCVFHNKDFYNGEWNSGVMHGYGQYIWGGFCNKSMTAPVEIIYEGTWANGYRHGVGAQYFNLEHGARYVGEFDTNHKEGGGYTINDNGDVIQRHPIFINDKPVHLASSDQLTMDILSQCAVNAPESLRTPGMRVSNPLLGLRIPSQAWLRPPLQTSRLDTVFEDCSLRDEQGCDSNVPKMYSGSHGTTLRDQTSNIHRIDRLQDFPEERPRCNPIIFHIRAEPETLDLSFYILKYINEVKEQWRYSSDDCPINTLDRKLKESDHSFWQRMLEDETAALRAVINQYSKILKTIYDIYAKITNDKKEVIHKTTLIRLYLWQFYRDIMIYKKGISVHDTDNILLEYPAHCLETNYEPFEPIYYWQFLWSLIGVAWQLHITKKNKVETYLSFSVATVFKDFLNKIVFPNAGKHYGPCLFAFKDLLPIQDVVALYIKVGPLLSAREFLKLCCCKKRTEPPCYKQHFGDNTVLEPQYGTNALIIGRNLVYIPDEKDKLFCNAPPEPYPLEIDKFFKTLKVFRHLGPQRIASCLTTVCPIIKQDGVIVNMNVVLTFLEFYETLIFCAYKSVLLANLKKRAQHVVFDEIRSRSDTTNKRNIKIKKDLMKKKKKM